MKRNKQEYKTKKTSKEVKRFFENTYGVPYDMRVKNLKEGNTEW